MTALVVCSRRAEYEVAAIRERLLLQNAVVVQALTKTQVAQVVHQGGEALAALRETFTENPTLRELATTPLMLSTLILTYYSTSIGDLPKSQAQLEEQVWTDYVERMVRQKGAERPARTGLPQKRYSLTQTCSWLGWLAHQMRTHNQTVFYAENLHWDWLASRQQQQYVSLAIRLPGVLVGILLNILVSSALPLDTSILQAGLIGGFLGGWLNWHASSAPVSPQKTGLAKHLLSLSSSVFFGVLLGTSFGLSLGKLFYSTPYGMGDWLRDGVIYGLAAGLSGWLLQILHLRLSRLPTPSPASQHRRHFRPLAWFKTLSRRCLLFSVVSVGTALGLANLLSNLLNMGIVGNDLMGSWLDSALSYVLGVGLTGFLLGLILELNQGEPRLAERLHWSGRYLLSLKHFWRCVLVASSLSLCFGLSSWLGDLVDNLFSGPALWLDLLRTLGYGLGIGLGMGLGYWLLVGLYQGIAQEHLEERDRRSFNQGVRRSLQNAAISSLVSSVPIAGIIILTSDLSHALSIALNNLVATGDPLGDEVSWLLRIVPDIGREMALSWGWLLARIGLLGQFYLDPDQFGLVLEVG